MPEMSGTHRHRSFCAVASFPWGSCRSTCRTRLGRRVVSDGEWSSPARKLAADGSTPTGPTACWIWPGIHLPFVGAMRFVRTSTPWEGLKTIGGLDDRWVFFFAKNRTDRPGTAHFEAIPCVPVAHVRNGKRLWAPTIVVSSSLTYPDRREWLCETGLARSLCLPGA